MIEDEHIHICDGRCICNKRTLQSVWCTIFPNDWSTLLTTLWKHNSVRAGEKKIYYINVPLLHFMFKPQFLRIYKCTYKSKDINYLYCCTMHSAVHLISPSLSLSLSHARTHARTHARAHAHTHTHIYIHTYYLRNLKFTLKHLKQSYMFRSYNHPQGAYIVPH